MGFVATVREAAANTPAGRNRVVDLWRAVSILVVVLGHWTMAAVTVRDGELVPGHLLVLAGWTHPLTWALQVMPVFFLVGGYANALSWRSARARGVAYAGWLRSRLRRLLVPVVPLLLAAGYHVHVDIAEAVARRPDVLATDALGPDDLLVDVLVDRLEAAGAAPGGVVVLAPAGSSDPRAQADSVETARRLAERWGGPVTLGYAAGPVPTVADAVRSAREAAGGRSVAVASYLLAPGFFQRRVEAAGGDVVTGPVAPDPRVVDLVVARYRAALAEDDPTAQPR